ncbi:hypothetical protein E3O06_04365 [Cryobacterium glaciale]|uniref:SsuA/THI5-like domain-containing protein n=1 Tax=Cryobacterium glaciale TaxID=1259145 RepID=A0A4R8V4G8_9MICO|nr:hypothetical protein E3O06_04365 [Cryobacterium glaciale]
MTGLRVAAGMSVIGLALSGRAAADAPAASGDLQTVNVGHVQLAIFSPLYVAEAKGYFEDEGIQLELEAIKQRWRNRCLLRGDGPGRRRALDHRRRTHAHRPGQRQPRSRRTPNVCPTGAGSCFPPQTVRPTRSGGSEEGRLFGHPDRKRISDAPWSPGSEDGSSQRLQLFARHVVSPSTFAHGVEQAGVN